MSITERIDAITKIPEEYRQERPPIPRSVKIELTGQCNFACGFCAKSRRLRDQKPMDRELFERLLLEMRSEGVEEIGLFYLGESFMCKWLPEAIDFAKNTAGFPYVFLTTNGSLASPERVEACMKAGLDSLKFSFNYADEDQFTEIAGVKGIIYTTIISNIKAANRVRLDGGYKTGLYASYIEYDGDQVEKMELALTEIRPYVDELYKLPLYNQASLIENDAWEFSAGNRGRADALRDALPCWAVFTEGHITWDGKLSACCFDHDGRFHMGDLTKQSFAEAWHSDKFQHLRYFHLKRNVKNTPCKTCVAYA